MRVISTFFFLVLLHTTSFSQGEPTTYFLPNLPYDSNIPSPEAYFGFPHGSWHLSHDNLIAYIKEIDQRSDRMRWQEYGRSHEGRQLGVLFISSKSNLNQLENIRKEHLKLSDPTQTIVNQDQPVVVYQGHSIHGNEASGCHAAVMMAYYWAAAPESEVAKQLSETVILFDPCFNPDGLQRFSTWVNQNKSKNLITDPLSREFNETWPGGRFNHYWFDLNRDWLVSEMPESIGRVKLFQAWRPNILTDHHEMGSNSTYYFHPGVPSRVHPYTPLLNQELTSKIANFHAKALDKIGSLYYTKEGFDDYYYGKGSTYPDVQGCVGILFEQASSRGHLQKTTNGNLSFAFTIRNQVTTSFSTIEAAISLKKELFEYQWSVYKNAQTAAAKSNEKAILFDAPNDPYLSSKLAELLSRHSIDVFHLAKTQTLTTGEFPAKSAWIVPLDQPQYALIRSCFDKMTTFSDSIFYDISAWTLPLAFNLRYEFVDSKTYSKTLLGEKYGTISPPVFSTLTGKDTYAFAINWDRYLAPKILYQLLKEDIVVKVASKPFSYANPKIDFACGTLIIPCSLQRVPMGKLMNLLQGVSNEHLVPVLELKTGMTDEGIDLGSPNLQLVRKPSVALLVGQGVTATDAGEIWHLLDTKYQIPVTLLESGNLNRALDKYSSLILVEGSFANVSASKIKEWVVAGGNIIAFGSANKWLKNNNFIACNYKPYKLTQDTIKTYASLENDRGALAIGGAIVAAKIDPSHPLCYGYNDENISLFRSDTAVLEKGKNYYSTPIRYSSKPLISGYMPREFASNMGGQPAVMVHSMGAGRIINIADNVAFRGFWYGTNRLLANAIFFAGLIPTDATETN